MSTKQLNVGAIADDVMVNAHDITATAAATPVAPVAPTPAQPALYDDDTSSRHGRVAARAITTGLKTATGEELDGDMSGTLGEVLGELFGLASRHVNRLIYMVMLGVFLLPVLAAVLFKILKPTEGKPSE